MGFIEKRPGERGYRARYRDPLGEQRSKTFGRKADAQRFLLDMEADKARGTWIDPRGRSYRWRRGPRSSCACADGSRRRRWRRTGGTYANSRCT